MTMNVYAIVKVTPEELEEGTFNFDLELMDLLQEDYEGKHIGLNKYLKGMYRLHELLCWREGIDGDEYPYNHLQTDYLPLPIQKAELKIKSENEMVITLTYAPYADGEFVTGESEEEELHNILIDKWGVTEYEKSGTTQADLRIIQRIYRLEYLATR